MPPDGAGKAKADDPATWAVRARAEAWAARNVNGAGGGIGLQLGAVPERPGASLGGVDLDTCRDPATGALAPWAAEVVATLGSYTEVSPSGTGVKVYFTYATEDLAALRAAMGTEHGRSFKRGKGEHPPAIELHIGNRYFAWTGQHLDGTPADLRPVALETLLWLIRVAGPDFAAAGAAGRSGTRRRPGRTMTRSRRACGPRWKATPPSRGGGTATPPGWRTAPAPASPSRSGPRSSGTGSVSRRCGTSYAGTRTPASGRRPRARRTPRASCADLGEGRRQARPGAAAEPDLRVLRMHRRHAASAAPRRVRGSRPASGPIST